MRHEAIEMVCAHVGQDRAPPPHHSDVLGVHVHYLIYDVMLVIHYYDLTNNYKRQCETSSFFLSMLLQGTGKIGPYLACKAPMINCTRQGVAHSVTVSWHPH